MDTLRRFVPPIRGPQRKKSVNVRSLSFDVTKIKGNKKNQRSIALSDEGVSLWIGDHCRWSVPREDVFRIERKSGGTDENPMFSVSVVQRYDFAAESETQLRRILEGFKALKLGNEHFTANNLDMGSSERCVTSPLSDDGSSCLGDSQASLPIPTDSGIRSGEPTTPLPSPSPLGFDGKASSDGVSNPKDALFVKRSGGDSPGSCERPVEFCETDKFGSTFDSDAGESTVDSNVMSPVMDELTSTWNGTHFEGQGTVFGRKCTQESFKIGATIGKGSFGRVVKAEYTRDGNVYALKMVDKERLTKLGYGDCAESEKRALIDVTHPLLIHCHGALESPRMVTFVLDYHCNGDLSEHVHTIANHPNKAEVVRFIASQLILALEKLHSNGVIYRDLKPSNVLLKDNGSCLLVDFGQAKWGQEGIEKAVKEVTTSAGRDQCRAESFVGTPAYIAPEVIGGRVYNHTVDFYSLGVLLYELWLGTTPFGMRDKVDMYQSTMKGLYEVPDSIDEDAREFIERLLKRNPKMRLGAEGIEKVKKHRYFRGINWEDRGSGTEIAPFIPKDPLSNLGETPEVFSQFL